jgi:hypothetical protein
MDDDAFHAIAQSIADTPAVQEKVVTLAPSIGLARVKPEGGLSVAPGTVLRYSPELFVDLIINNPDYSSKQLGEIFGKPQSWVAQVLASANFQAALDPRRAEVLNPEYAMTLEERFRGLTIRSLTVLQEKLEAGKALPDLTVVKIAELGIKALGMGQKVAEKAAPDEAPKNSSEMVADRIMAAMAKRKAAEQGDAVDVEAVEVSNG